MKLQITLQSSVQSLEVTPTGVRSAALAPAGLPEVPGVSRPGTSVTRARGGLDAPLVVEIVPIKSQWVNHLV